MVKHFIYNFASKYKSGILIMIVVKKILISTELLHFHINTNQEVNSHSLFADLEQVQITPWKKTDWQMYLLVFSAH